MQFNIENLARDLAFEIHLGGDRFGPDDLHEWLHGIPSADLATFRDRVMLHSKDFAPNEGRFTQFAQRMLASWLLGIQTAELLGREVKPGQSWFAGLTLSDDKGKYFAFTDGSIKQCGSATVEAAWGNDVRRSIIKEMSPLQVIEHMAGQVVSLDKEGKHTGKAAFITHSSIPGGDILSVYSRGGEYYLQLSSGALGLRDVPLKEAFEAFPTVVLDCFNYELDERVYRQVREAEQARQDIADFRLKAAELIDRKGERVRSDFLYDQVLLESNERGQVYVRRSVDDLAPSCSLDFYILTVTSKGNNHVALVSEDFDAGVLNRLSGLVDTLLQKEPIVASSVSAEQMSISFPGNVEVGVPEFSAGAPLRMKVDRVYMGADGELMVSGDVKYDGRVSRMDYPLSSLSDKSLKAVREATDGLLPLFETLQPRPELNVTVVKAPKVKGGLKQ